MREKMNTISSSYKLSFAGLIVCLLTGCSQAEKVEPSSASFAVSFTANAADEMLDGRIILILSKSDDEEPRFQVRPGVRAVQIFGVNVEAMQPGQEVVVDDSVFGYPHDSLADVPDGEYFVQALLHKYDTFNLSNGKAVKLPMDQGEGQQWAESPGNIYSEPRMVQVSSGTGPSRIVMDRVIEPIVPPEDTEFIKHVRIRSEMLSEFWGRDMYLGAHVLLPSGFDEHPEAKPLGGNAARCCALCRPRNAGTRARQGVCGPAWRE